MVSLNESGAAKITDSDFIRTKRVGAGSDPRQTPIKMDPERLMRVMKKRCKYGDRKSCEWVEKNEKTF